jgi:drug/metabolite transporter (DMT)-like permease
MLAGYLCALAATIFWSGNFIIARELNDTVAPVSLAFGRWLVAVLVLFPFAIKSLLSEWITVKENLAYLSITAFTGVTLFNTLLYMGGTDHRRIKPGVNLNYLTYLYRYFCTYFYGKS